MNGQELSFNSAIRSRAVVGCTTDLCSPSPCQNGGACRVSGLAFECQCSLGFEGSVCETGQLATCVRDCVMLGGSGADTDLPIAYSNVTQHA